MHNGFVMSDKNQLYFGDNLDVLGRYVADESVDLVYLDPPFNSNANYNVLFKEHDGAQAASQIQAFEDTWRWDEGLSRHGKRSHTEQPRTRQRLGIPRHRRQQSGRRCAKQYRRGGSVEGLSNATPNMRLKGGEKMPTTGEKPGKGKYRCTKCGTIVRLDDSTDTLPPCAKCANTEFTKVG